MIEQDVEMAFQNLVINPGFETNTSGNPNPWAKYQSGTKAAFTYPVSPGRDGQGYCVQITYPSLESGKQAYWRQNITVTANTTYICSGWMKTSSIGNVPSGSSGGATIQIDWYTGSWNYISSTYIIHNKLGTTNWTNYVNNSVTSPNNAAYAGLFLRLANCIGSVWYDDVLFGLSVSNVLIVTLAVNPSTITLGQSATFTATATGGSGGYKYKWNNLPLGCTSTDSPTIICTPTNSGTYDNIYVTVTDSTGTIVTSNIVKLIVNPSITVVTKCNDMDIINIGKFKLVNYKNESPSQKECISSYNDGSFGWNWYHSSSDTGWAYPNITTGDTWGSNTWPEVFEIQYKNLNTFSIPTLKWKWAKVPESNTQWMLDFDIYWVDNNYNIKYNIMIWLQGNPNPAATYQYDVSDGYNVYKLYKGVSYPNVPWNWGFVLKNRDNIPIWPSQDTLYYIQINIKSLMNQIPDINFKNYAGNWFVPGMQFGTENSGGNGTNSGTFVGTNYTLEVNGQSASVGII